MFSKMRNFLSRHKRKFLVSGVIIGGSVLLVRYAQHKLREFQETQAKELADKFKRMQHFESTERTCNQTIAGLSPTLGEKILKELDTNVILEKLRSNPDNKMELWDELKIASFTRIATFVYASSILVVTLRVQLNILGGYVYKDTIISNEKNVTLNIQTMYLSLIQQLIGDGMSNLIEIIEKNVLIIMQRYSLKQKLTLADTETLFWSIQMAINNEEQNPIKHLTKYALPAEVNGNDILNKMYAETLDVLESAEVTDLCMTNVSRGFSLVIDKIAEYYAKPIENAKAEPGPSGIANKSALNVEVIENINSVEIALAKLIPIINGLASKTLHISGPQNEKVQDMISSLIALYMQSEKVKMLGANVYEAFCQ